MLSAEVPVAATPSIRLMAQPPPPAAEGAQRPAKASIGVNVNLCDLVDEGFAVDDAFEVRDCDDVEGITEAAGTFLSPTAHRHCQISSENVVFFLEEVYIAATAHSSRGLRQVV